MGVEHPDIQEGSLKAASPESILYDIESCPISCVGGGSGHGFTCEWSVSNYSFLLQAVEERAECRSHSAILWPVDKPFHHWTCVDQCELISGKSGCIGNPGKRRPLSFHKAFTSFVTCHLGIQMCLFVTL